MEQFITVEFILSFAGMIAVVAGFTQLAKKYVSYDPKWLVLIFSIIMSLIRIILVSDYSVAGIITGLLNIIPVTLSAIGAYETLIKPITK